MAELRAGGDCNAARSTAGWKDVCQDLQADSSPSLSHPLLMTVGLLHEVFAQTSFKISFLMTLAHKSSTTEHGKYEDQSSLL